MGTTHLFCPTMCFSLPDPDFCCHILSSVSLYCLLSIVYSSRERCHLSLSATVFPSLQPSWLDPIFLPFQSVVPTPPPLWLSFMVIPIHLGASFISHLAFLVLHGSLLSSVGFFLCLFGGFFWSYSSHWTLRFLPQQRRCLPFCPPCSEYLD